jgi:hypothetical protein
MDSDADDFRKQAEDCRAFAARARKPIDKASWLRLAEDWLKLADEADGAAAPLTAQARASAVGDPAGRRQTASLQPRGAAPSLSTGRRLIPCDCPGASRGFFVPPGSQHSLSAVQNSTDLCDLRAQA